MIATPSPAPSPASAAPGASFTVVQSGNGKRIYVAVTGNDSGDGSPAKPYASLRRALVGVEAGATIYIGGGTYAWTDGTSIAAIGRSDDWIVIRPTETTPGTPDQVVLRGSGNFAVANPYVTGNDCLRVNGSYIDVRSLVCDSYVRYGFFVDGAHHVRVTGSVFRNTGVSGLRINAGVNAAGPSGAAVPAYEIEFSGNTVDNTNLFWRRANFNATPNLPPWGGGIGAFGDRVTIRGNTVNATFGEGMNVSGVNQWVAENTVTNSCAVNIYLDTASDTLVERNFIAHTDPGFFADCQITDYSGGKPITGTGIQVAAETDSYTGKAQDRLQRNVIRNNIVVNTRRPFWYGSYNYDQKGGDGMKATRVVNNSFVGGTEGLLYLERRCVRASNQAACLADPRTAHEDTVFANNVFYWTQPTAGLGIAVVDNRAGISFTNNLWFSVSAGAAAGSNEVSGDPLFADPNGRTAASFKIGSTSAAIGRANPGYAPPNDYFGAARRPGGPTDIGAVNGP